jgi:hypothetical protein
MSRFVWPYLFTLRAGNLVGVSKNRNLPDVRAKFFPKIDGSAAIALRWSTRPTLGFPREPFQVYRRQRNTIEGAAAVPVLTSASSLFGPAQTFPVLPGGDAAYVVIVRVAVTASNSIMVQAVDVYGLPIPNQVLSLTHLGSVEFRCPGIGAVSVSGTGAVLSIEAIGETAYANLPDWVPIQTVGLPLENNEIGAFYKTTPQGFWPDPLTPPTLDGVTAATLRTFITAELESPPPPTGLADFPLPPWPQPNPVAYVANIRSASNLMPMIERCLENSIDSDPALMQAAYSETVTTDGLGQIGTAPPSPAQSSQVSLPITGIAMLAVSTDPYAAVALGYGTLDLPPQAGNAGAGIGIVPTAATVFIGKTQQFTAATIGTAGNTNTVIWSVNGVPGGNASLGTITGTGLYTTPAAVPTPNAVTVIATNGQNLSSSASAVVTIERLFIPIPVPVPAPMPVPGPVLTPAPVSRPAAAAVSQPTAAPAAVPAAVDIPISLPPADNYGAFDYMVTAPFTFPFGLTATLAALSTGQLPVEAPVALTSALSQAHAPLERDQPISAAVRVSWQAASAAQGYGILVSRAPNQSQVLNAKRASSVGGYDVFIGLAPSNPDQNTPPDQQNPAFSDLECTLPLAAPPVTSRYLVGAQDVFGQWSNWVETDTTLSPAPVTKPGLINAEFLYQANSGSPPSPIVPATLRIDFGWNWQDRAPGAIRFTGQFVAAPATTLAPAYLGGFSTSSDGPIGTPVILTFSYSGSDPDTVDPHTVIPAVTSGHTTNGPVVILGSGSPPSPVNPNLVQYRVELTGLQLDFSTASELDFLVYATATEEVQPGVWSDPTDQSTSNVAASPPPPPPPPPPPLFIGKIVRAVNPNPPTVTFTPPPISWTALPDATGMARGVLQWQPDPNAAGYFVWEATETALLHLLPPGSGTADPPAGTPIPTRATTLKNLLDANQDASLQAFARLTEHPISAASTEVTLPGSAQTLYVFRISAIGQNNVESARSASVAIFGVPHRNVPGIPRLLLRPAPGSPSGIRIILLPVASNAPPAGYRLFRVRSQTLSQNGSTMGPAKYDENSPLWQNYNGATLSGTPLNGLSLLDTAAAPSWYPYYYRATAIGEDDPANGVHAGESSFSSVQGGYVLPAEPPLITSFSVALAPFMTAALVTLTTDLPAADASPVGSARVELLQLGPEGSPPASPPGPLMLRSLHAELPNLITEGTIALPPTPPTTIRLARSASDASGRWTLYMLIPYSPAEEGSFVLRLTDPLARQSTASF